MKVIEKRPIKQFSSVVVELTYEEARLIAELSFRAEVGGDDTMPCNSHGRANGSGRLWQQFEAIGVVRRDG